MIITKKQQEKLVSEYESKGHPLDQCETFVDGMNAAFKLVDKILKQEQKK